MPTVTKEDAMAYIGIDYEDTVVTKNLTRSMATAQQKLRGAVGEEIDTFLPEDPRAVELVLAYTDEAYSKRGVSAKEANAKRSHINDLEQQLIMEMRRKKEEAGAL